VQSTVVDQTKNKTTAIKINVMSNVY